jgi:hypothetical protein
MIEDNDEHPLKQKSQGGTIDFGIETEYHDKHSSKQ